MHAKFFLRNVRASFEKYQTKPFSAGPNFVHRNDWLDTSSIINHTAHLLPHRHTVFKTLDACRFISTDPLLPPPAGSFRLHLSLSL